MRKWQAGLGFIVFFFTLLQCPLCNAFISIDKPETRIVLTAALINHKYYERKKEYINAISILNRFGYNNLYIIESVRSHKTFLDDYCENVIYTNSNNFNLQNKGVNEGNAIVKSLDKLDCKDEDIVVKLTGRYYFISDSFLKTIQSNPSIDVFAKLFLDGQVFTGCFAMRYKYFKEMFSQFDYEKMEREMISIEIEVANYIRSIAKEKNARVMYLDNLDIVANVFGVGNCELLRM